MQKNKEVNLYLEFEAWGEPVEPIFEFNCLQIDGVTPGGCPVCPLCKEPAYEKTHCVFCGVKFK